MEDYFASIPMTNSMMLCVGGITRRETEMALNEGAEIDGSGYYLFLANETEPNQPVEVLAKFLTVTHAARVAELFERKAAYDLSH